MPILIKLICTLQNIPQLKTAEEIALRSLLFPAPVCALPGSVAGQLPAAGQYRRCQACLGYFVIAGATVATSLA